MDSRMDRYNSKEDNVPTRSDKNKELYRQIYNAYDEFENLVVPSNATEIDISDLKKEVTSRDEYHKLKDFGDIKLDNPNYEDELVKENKSSIKREVYDIKELLDKAVSEKKGPELIETDKLSNADYLKKLKLDNVRNNMNQVKNVYEDGKEESLEEDVSLLKTANLSLEILSDLKGDKEDNTIEIKNDKLVVERDNDFYSNEYKFSKRDFENKEIENTSLEEEDDDEEFDLKDNSSKTFLKIFLLVFGISLVAIIIIFLFNYLNRV